MPSSAAAAMTASACDDSCVVSLLALWHGRCQDVQALSRIEYQADQAGILW